MINRSQWILDMERDLALISKRLHALEEYFEDNGLITQLVEAAHELAVKLEALEAKINASAKQ